MKEIRVITTFDRGEYFRDQLDAMQRFINAAR